MRRLPFLFLLALTACRSGEREPEVAAPVDRPAPRYRREKPPAWFDEQIAAAARELGEGRYEEGLARVYRARAYGPGEQHDVALKQLLGQLNREVLELETLVGWVEPDKDPITFGDDVRIRIYLHNAGTRPIRIPARAKGTSPSIFILDVTRRDFDIRAQVVATTRRVHQPLAADIEIPPGGLSEVVLTVPRAGNDRPLDGFRTFTVRGRLRAGVVEVGGLRRWEAIALQAGSLRSFRPNYEQLTQDPLRRVGQSLEKSAPVHLLTAAALLPYAQRREAVDRLVAALGSGRAMDWAVIASLRYLTGIDEFGMDAEAWRAWWPRVRETYFELPLESEPGQPRFDARG